MRWFLVFFVGFLLSFHAFSQPSEYQPRGVKSYLVNYGAINGDRYLATFAARRFVLLDEASSRDINLVRRVNPGMPILHYKDIVALHDNRAEFEKVNRDEAAFLHSSEPSSMTVIMRRDTVRMYWLPDRRRLDIVGYRLYWSFDSTGAGQPIIDSVITGTTFSARLPKHASWVRVTTVLRDGAELQYGYSVRRTGTVASGPALALRTLNARRNETEVRITVAAELVNDITPDSVVLVCDVNRNNKLDTLGERTVMLKTGRRYNAEIAAPVSGRTFGGYECILLVYLNGARSIFPASGSYTTNINNRLKHDYYGFYVMKVGSSTWRQSYIEQVLKSFSERGYSGLFEDDCWFRVRPWGVDAFPPWDYNDKGWEKDLYVFMDSIKLRIAPRPAVFNGLSSYSLSLLPHADGGMTEGFGYTHWSGYVTGSSWKRQCDAGLAAQHEYRKLWLPLGGAPFDDPMARMYVLGSYLLVADSLSMFANATNYQEFSHFPEFDISLGRPLESAEKSVEELERRSQPGNIAYYVREFENGTVVVNPHPSAPVVFPEANGKRFIVPVGGTTVNGGILRTRLSSDTIAPRTARIYPGKNAVAVLASPVIDSIVVSPLPAPADGQTRITMRARARDTSSSEFHSDTTKPMWIAADLGELGGPKELRLDIEGTWRFGKAHWYSGSFTVPVGAPPSGADVPVTAFSTTGLVSVRRTRIETVSADSTNLVLNFSFEIDNDEDGVPDFWRPYSKGFDYDTSGRQARTGRRSIHVANDSAGDQRGIYIRIDLNQTTPRDLKLSGWSKANNVSGSKNNDYALYADLYYSDGTALYGQTARFSTGTHDWEYAEKTIRPAKPVKQVNLYALFRRHTGEAWFDQVELRGYTSPTHAATHALPSAITLNQNFPNPFVDATVISYTVKQPGTVNLDLFNILGEVVYSRNTFHHLPGTYSLQLAGNDLAPGVYFCRLKSRGEMKVIKLVRGLSPAPMNRP